MSKPLLSIRSRVVIASCLTQAIIIGCMFSYGVYFKILEEELGWSRTLLSASTSIMFLVMGFAAILVGKLNDRYGPRWVLSIAGISTGIGYCLFSGITMPWQLLAVFTLFVGIGLSAHDVVTLSTVASWFDKRRGIMTGVVKTGTAMGQVFMPILVTLLIASFGWRESLMVLGITVGVVLLIVAQWMQFPAHRKSASSSKTQSPESITQGLSYEQARRSPALWVLCAIQFCYFPTLITIPLHIVVHSSDLGMTTAKAATVLSMIGACSIVGRLSIGALFDKIAGKRALILCLVPLVLSLFSLLFIDQANWLFGFALVYGIAHGGLFTVVSPTVAEYFGMRAHGAVFGTIVLFGTLGGAAGPLLAGITFDKTGSYDFAFITLATLATIAMVLALRLKPPKVA